MPSRSAYPARFEALARELRAHPSVAVTHARLFPPVRGGVERLERALGRPVTGALRAFYEACDGVQLCWVHKRTATYDPALYAYRDEDLRASRAGGARDDYRAALEEAPRFDGVIAIGSVLDVAPDPEVNTYEYEGREYALGRFDAYAPSRDVALFFPDGASEPLLVHGRDYSADYGDSARFDLPTYLEFVLHTKGMTKERYYLCSDEVPARWSPLDEDPAYFSKLRPVDLSDYAAVYDSRRAQSHRFPFSEARDVLGAPCVVGLAGRRARYRAKLEFDPRNEAPKEGLEGALDGFFAALRARGCAVEDEIVCASAPWSEWEFEFTYELAAGDDRARGHARVADELRAELARVEGLYGYLPDAEVELDEPG